MEPISFVLITLAGLVSGFYGTLVGGASLLTIPSLILLGLPAKLAIGTNRFSMLGGTSVGLYKFNKKKMVKYKIGLTLVLFSVIGSIIGSNLTLQVSDVILKKVVGIFVTTFLILTFFWKDYGTKKKEVKMTTKRWVFSCILIFIAGIYRGFQGGGTAVIESYILISMFGLTFIESAGTRKIMSVTSNFTSFIVFLINGYVDFLVGSVLLVSLGIGSYLGAHYSDRIGNSFIPNYISCLLNFR